jgi:DNA replication protein
MMFESKTTDDLIKIAIASGGFVLNAGPRTTDDLVRIAYAATNNGARLVFHGLSERSTDDLVRIAKAGRGSVQFVE